MKGKIYKLICKTDGSFYIGSTNLEVEDRFSVHQIQSRYKKSKMYDHFNKEGWENVSVVLLMNYECATKDDLLKKETEFILSEKSNPLCLNKNRAYISGEDMKAYQKAYQARYRTMQKEKRRAEKSAECAGECAPSSDCEVIVN